MDSIKLYHGDCLEIMDRLINEGIKVDAIITDPPYGTTACKWDSVIPFDAMWSRLNKLIKSNGAIVLFGSEPFSSSLRMSNLKQWKYDWIWEKEGAGNFVLTGSQPLNKFENISVFGNFGKAYNSKIKACYYPQGIIEINKKQKSTKNRGGIFSTNKNGGTPLRESKGKIYTQRYTNHPYSLIKFNRDHPYIHPTQKPVALMEYLIKTYTLEGETILDFTMGSGTTGVACKNLNRNFIGIEKEEEYYNITKERIENTQNRLFHE